MIPSALSTNTPCWLSTTIDEFAEIEENLKNCQIGCLPIYVKPSLDKWVYDNNIVLIGDASHAYGPGGTVTCPYLTNPFTTS